MPSTGRPLRQITMSRMPQRRRCSDPGQKCVQVSKETNFSQSPSPTNTPRTLVKAGVLDPTKVVRTALQNAGSIASLMLTTEALIAEIPEKKEAPAPGGHGGGMGDMY